MPARILRILISKIGERSIRGQIFRTLQFRVPLCPFPFGRFRNFPSFIHIPIPFGRIIRAMRTGKRHLQEQRLLCMIITDKPASGLPRPKGRMQMFIQPVKAGRMVIPPDTGLIRIPSGSVQLEPFPIIADEILRLNTSALVYQRFMKPVQRILRVPMHLADTECIISQVS